LLPITAYGRGEINAEIYYTDIPFWRSKDFCEISKAKMQADQYVFKKDTRCVLQ